MHNKIIQKLEEQYSLILQKYINHPDYNELTTAIEERFIQSLSPIIGAQKLCASNGIIMYSTPNKIIQIDQTTLGSFNHKDIYLNHPAEQILNQISIEN